MITEEHFGQLQNVIDRALDNTDLLAKWQVDYVNEWADKLDVHGPRIRISDKQQWVFDEILRKLEKHGV